MTLPDSAFRWVPMLKGKVQDPAGSKFRDMEARIRDLDADAVAAGRPDWRLSDEEREASRFEVLKGREGKDLWVFAYGSLIWDPGVWFAEARRASASGFRRRFCMHLDGGRGSAERPGLMCSLDRAEGETCEGIALRIAAPLVEEETRLMWMREMLAGSYIADFIPLETPQGPVEALAFLVRRDHDRYIDLPDGEAAKRIAFAEGVLGTNFEYLASLIAHLETLGVHDPQMAALHEACRALREAEGA